MKTTIELPDEVFHRAKIVAAQRKTTLKELVLQGLLHVTQSSSKDEQNRRKSLQRLVAALKATNSKPMSPMNRKEIYDRRGLL